MNNKIKMWSGITALCVITVVSALNLAIIMNKDSSYKLNYKDIEAVADGEVGVQFNSMRLITLLCDDYKTYINFCDNGAAWEYCVFPEVCPVLTNCERYGHSLNVETFCFKYCNRVGCNYSEPKVPCDSIKS